MVSEIIWGLVGVVWLITSIYICYLVFKYGSKIMKGFIGKGGTFDMSKTLNELQKFNRHIKK